MLPLHGQVERAGVPKVQSFPAASPCPQSAHEEDTLLGQGVAALVLLQVRVIQVAGVAVLGGVWLSPGRAGAPHTHTAAALRAGAVQLPRDPGPGSVHSPTRNGKGKLITIQTHQNASCQQRILRKKKT